MFERSRNWSVYGLPLKNTYRDAADVLRDGAGARDGRSSPVDGATYAGATIPGTQPKQLLMMTSRDDCAVPNVAGFFQARSLGLKLVMPSVLVPFGFETRAGAQRAQRGDVIVDEHPTPVPPETNLLVQLQQRRAREPAGAAGTPADAP